SPARWKCVPTLSADSSVPPRIAVRHPPAREPARSPVAPDRTDTQSGHLPAAGLRARTCPDENDLLPAPAAARQREWQACCVSVRLLAAIAAQLQSPRSLFLRASGEKRHPIQQRAATGKRTPKI